MSCLGLLCAQGLTLDTCDTFDTFNARGHFSVLVSAFYMCEHKNRFACCNASQMQLVTIVLEYKITCVQKFCEMSNYFEF